MRSHPKVLRLATVEGKRLVKGVFFPNGCGFALPKSRLSLPTSERPEGKASSLKRVHGGVNSPAAPVDETANSNTGDRGGVRCSKLFTSEETDHSLERITRD